MLQVSATDPVRKKKKAKTGAPDEPKGETFPSSLSQLGKAAAH